MTLLIRSWYLARSLGVTKQPPDDGIKYFDVKIEGGPKLWWPKDAKLTKEKTYVFRFNGR